MARDVVLLHGFTHTGASWDPVVAALAERYRALAPDIRGHGAASRREPVTLEAVLDDLAAQAPERFTLVGYSMGGRIALHAALAPALAERVEQLVLIGASPGIADPAERAERRAADDRLAGEVERMTIEEFAQRWARTPVLAGQPPAVAAAVHADRLRNQPAGLAAALRGLGTGALPSLWDRLAEIRPSDDADRRRARREVHGNRERYGPGATDGGRRRHPRRGSRRASRGAGGRRGSDRAAESCTVNER